METKIIETASLEGVPTEMYDWEGKETNVLVLNYTMACPLKCDFCCYGCHPKRTEKMSLELAKRVIIEGSELGVFSSVGFTGGEPLLYPDEILELSELMNSLGMKFTIATAAHWGNRIDRVDRLLKKLSDNGLVRLNISYDPSHAEFIPKSSIINVVNTSSKHAIATYVVGTFYNPDQSMETYMPELLGMNKVKLVTKYVSKTGRARDLDISQSTYNLDLELDSLSCYRRINHDVVVWFDGAVYPCCSTFNRDTPGICVGNINEESLSVIWQRIEGSLLYRVMKRKGFGYLYDVIKKYDFELYGELPSPKESVGPCSLCNNIFNNELVSGRVKEVIRKYEIDCITRSLEYIQNIGGDDLKEALVRHSLDVF